MVAEAFFRFLAKSLWLVLGGCLLLALIDFALMLMGSMLDLAGQLAAKAKWELILLVYVIFFVLVLLGVLFAMLCELVVIFRRERDRRKREAEYLSSITGTDSRGEKAH